VYSPCVIGHLETYGLLGERLYVDDDIEVTALGVIASSAEPATGVQGVLALYGDSGGIPSGLLANTASTTIGPGGNVIPVVSSGSITAGYYWIMAEYDGDAAICEDSSMDNPLFNLEAGYGAVPATIVSPMAADGADINYYVVGTLSTQ
jgi:hypothetical protein